MKPTVSIIVPVYNCARYIEDCLRSITRQTCAELEVIVVNDGSTDDSEAVIRSYLPNDPRIVYRSQPNQGPSAARNEGLRLATGDYIAFVDADDTAAPDYIRSLLDEMRRRGADLVCCGYVERTAAGKRNHTDFDFPDPIGRLAFMELVCGGTGGVLWGKLFRADLIRRHGLRMDPGIFMSEDLVFVLQYCAQASSFASVKRHLYEYNRMNAGSISTSPSPAYLGNQVAVCRHIERILTDAGYPEHRAGAIVADRMRAIVLSLAELQGAAAGSIGMRAAAGNIRSMLRDDYVRQYRERFAAHTWIDKLYLAILARDYAVLGVLYGMGLHALRRLKSTMKREGKEGM